MPILPVSESSDIDYEVLKYIAEMKIVSIDELKERFPNMNSLKYRLEQLARVERSKTPPYLPIVHSRNYIREHYYHRRNEFTYFGFYQISDYGQKVLDDYARSNKSQKKGSFREHILFPLLISAITAIVGFIIGRLV